MYQQQPYAYVVVGKAGDDDFAEEWIVAVYSNHQQAFQHVNRAQRRANKLFAAVRAHQQQQRASADTEQQPPPTTITVTDAGSGQQPTPSVPCPSPTPELMVTEMNNQYDPRMSFDFGRVKYEVRPMRMLHTFDEYLLGPER